MGQLCMVFSNSNCFVCLFHICRYSLHLIRIYQNSDTYLPYIFLNQSSFAELGWPIFVGFGIMLVAFPLFLVGGIIMKRLQQEQLKNKDQRIKMINEILGGIKVLKLYGWEPSFVKQVQLFTYILNLVNINQVSWTNFVN